jgi:hypothetical protein
MEKENEMAISDRDFSKIGFYLVYALICKHEI